MSLASGAVLVVIAILVGGCREPGGDGEASVGLAMEGTGSVLDDAGKQALILQILERFVPRAESFFRASDLREPATGRYDAVGSGVTQPRGAGDIAYAYVTLLAARPEQASFGGVAREVLVDHTIQSIRHEALTSALSGAGYNRWGNGTWQASLETYSWAFAAWRLWDRLDAQTRDLVRRVVGGEANILLTKFIASGEEGDTGAEDNAWNSTTPALAAVMFPDDPDAPAWRNAAIRLALNASSTAADRTSTDLVDGRPLGEWMASVNLHPDLTLENHGFFNPIYQQVTHVDIGDSVIAYAEAGAPLPEAFSFRTEAIWERVLMRLATDDGDFAMPAGQDWTSKDFQHLEYLGILATRFARPDASLLESRAIALVARRQSLFPSGSLLGQAQIGYETMLVKRLSALYQHHRRFGPSPVPTPDEFQRAFAGAAGVAEYHHSDFIVGRVSGTLATMSWDPARPMALVIPSGEASLDDPVFSYYAPGNLLGPIVGSVSAHACACETDRFSTAGVVGARRFSMTAFPDGVVMLLDRGEGATFTYALDDLPGLQGPRPVWSRGGAGTGALTGDWVNAADRLGMVVRGGAGLQTAAVAGANPQIVITGSTGTGSGHRGALLLPLAGHEATAALEPYVVQPGVPGGWSALQARAPDQSGRLAIARWDGPPTAPIEIRDERGAPVPAEPAHLDGDAARFTARLAAPSSRGEILRFFVRAPGPLSGQQDGEDAVILRNPSPTPIRVAVSYLPAGGPAQSAIRVLAGGEAVRARAIVGALSLAGPELETALDARGLLANLLAAAPPSPRPEVAALVEATRTALASVDRLLEDIRASDPDPRRIAAGIDIVTATFDALEQIAANPLLPYEIRALALRVVADARAQLDATRAALTVSLWAEPLAAAQPGEPLPIRVVALNRGPSSASSGTVAVTAPDGWAGAGPARVFDGLAPGQSATAELALQVPPAASLGHAMARAELAYRVGVSERRRSAEILFAVDPIIHLGAPFAAIPLAAGGVNQAAFQLSNLSGHPIDVRVSATTMRMGATVDAPEPRAVPAGATVDVVVPVRGAYLTSGTAPLAFTAQTAAGAAATAHVELAFSDDLVQSTLGTPWPRLDATSQAAFPPRLAGDGDSATFWVSDGTAAGQGPTPTHPVTLTADFGAPARFGTVVMVPRTSFGPTAYTIEASNDSAAWVEVAAVPSAPNGTVITRLAAPVTARYARLRMTGGYDRIQPPRNVQIASFMIRGVPFEGDLAQSIAGSSFPAVSASSSQAAFPPARAVDGDTTTFWVSDGTQPGQGPSPTSPQTLAVDLGAPARVGTVVMVPRIGFGPSSYRIEVSLDAVNWTAVASVPSAPDGTVPTQFEPASARYIRLVITGGHDAIQPPRNVQVASFVVLPAD